MFRISKYKQRDNTAQSYKKKSTLQHLQDTFYISV